MAYAQDPTNGPNGGGPWNDFPQTAGAKIIDQSGQSSTATQDQIGANSITTQPQARSGGTDGPVSGAIDPGQFDPNSWVTTALQGAKSTDDPGYWQQKISQDPNVQNAATRDSALAYWQDRINRGDGAQLGLPKFQDGASASGSTSSSTSTQAPVIPATTQPYQQTPQDSQLYNLLMGRAQQSLNVSPDDPIIKGQTDAFRASQDRGVRSYLSAAAEKGGAHTDLDATARSAYEKAGQSTSAMQASLMQNELNSRRQEIQSALSESGSLLSNQDQLALQRELGIINAQLGQESIGNSFNLGQQQINSGNDQFAANFGLNSTNQANYWDSLRSGLL